MSTVVAMETDNIGAVPKVDDQHEEGYSIEELPKSSVFTASHIRMQYTHRIVEKGFLIMDR